jgi:hypothetical protein
MSKIINATGQGGACQYDCGKKAISSNIHKKNISKNVGMCQVFFRKKYRQLLIIVIPPLVFTFYVLGVCYAS